MRPPRSKLEIRMPAPKGMQTIKFEIKPQAAHAPTHDVSLYLIVREVLHSMIGGQMGASFETVCGWRDQADNAGSDDPSQVVVSALQDVILAMGEKAQFFDVFSKESEGFLCLSVKRQINNILGLNPNTTKRKIVQIAPMSGIPEAVYALCDDGTLWHNYGPADWYQVPTIPQPKTHVVTDK